NQETAMKAKARAATAPMKKTRRAHVPLPGRGNPAAASAVIDLVPARLKLKKILVPTDFSKFSGKALRYATEFAQQFGASITLVHVVEPIVYPPESGYAPVEIEAVETTWKKNAKQKLEELARQSIPPPVTAQIAVRFGSPYYEITALAKE